MPRKDYDEIKNKFESFVRKFRSRDISDLDDYVVKNVRVNLSTSENLTGEENGFEGIARFINTYPITDHLNLPIYNYVCRIKGSEAQQLGYVVCSALDEVPGSDEYKHYLYCHIIVNHWTKREDGWKMDSIKMDFYEGIGELREKFEKTWHIEDGACTGVVHGEHPLVIVGEIDSPYNVFPDAEDVLTEEEKIKEAVTEYNFGIDVAAFDHVVRAFADDLSCYGSGMTMFLLSGKHERISMLKMHRQPNRIWTHGYKFMNIDIDGDRAKVYAARIIGHRQPECEYVWKKGGENKEHLRADLNLDMIKRNGRWQIQRFNYELPGIKEYGDYGKSLYNDLV